MKRPLKIAASVIGLGVLAVGGAWLATILFGNNSGDRAAKLDVALDEKLISRGAYLAIAGDCSACHTPAKDKPFAGGLPLSTPIGQVYSTNITPAKTYGIGSYSYGDFERAVRRGVTPHGRTLYPAMPYPAYAHITDADMQALYAYFENGVKPVAEKNKTSNIPWPLSMRWPLTYWRWLFAPTVQSTGRISSEALLDRGAYIVEGLGHCGTCHTPRGLGLEEEALTDSDGSRYLSGAIVGNYLASDLRGDPFTGLGAWSESDIVQFLKTGLNKKSGVFGGMSDVVFHSTQAMTEEDLNAIAHYLKSLPGTKSETAFSYDSKIGAALASGNTTARGALDYLNNCAACHLSSGQGYSETFPGLAGNPVVNAANPASIVNIILNGSALPGTAGAPTRFAMPAFGARLTDQETADIASFIRSSWGNRASPVAKDEIAKLRAATHAANPTLAGK